MNKATLPSLIIILSGAVLITVGICLIVFQVIDERNSSGGWPGNMSSLGAPQFSVKTSYVGMELVVVGAALEIAGFVGASLRRSR